MGRWIDSFIGLVRFLKATGPKYSLEIALFNGCLLIASIVFGILEEYKLYAITAIMLLLSLGVQMIRVRRMVKRKLRELDNQVMQAYLAYVREQHADAEKKMNHEQHAAETARLLTLLKEDITQAIQEKRVEG